MRKMLLIAAAAALLAPVAAFADKPPTKPPHPLQAQNGSKPAPKVLYILRGTVSAYTQGTSIAINVTSANRHGRVLKDQTQPLTFTNLTGTKIVLHKHAAIAPDDHVIVKVRFAKTFSPATDLTAFEGTPVKQIIDQGKHASSGQGQGNSHASTWLYVLHGSVTGVDNPTTPTTLTISVTSANHYGKTVLEDASLTFSVGPKVVYANGASAPIESGDHVIVKVSGPKKLTATTDLTPGTAPFTTSKQIIDQGK